MKVFSIFFVMLSANVLMATADICDSPLQACVNFCAPLPPVSEDEHYVMLFSINPRPCSILWYVVFMVYQIFNIYMDRPSTVAFPPTEGETSKQSIAVPGEEEETYHGVGE